MKTFTTHSAQETVTLGEIFAKDCRPGDVIAFFGGLGMGKTAFMRGLVKGLGIRADVTSPTFSLVNEYKGDAFTVYHFDMYRISSWEDLYSTGFFISSLPGSASWWDIWMSCLRCSPGRAR